MEGFEERITIEKNVGRDVRNTLQTCYLLGAILLQIFEEVKKEVKK